MFVYYDDHANGITMVLKCQNCFKLLDRVTPDEAAGISRIGRPIFCLDCEMESGIEDESIYGFVKDPDFLCLDGVYVLIDPENKIAPKGYRLIIPKESWPDYKALFAVTPIADCLSLSPKIAKTET